MKVTLGTKELREAVNIASVAGRKRTSLPITNDILLEVGDKRLTVKGTDLQDKIITTIPCTQCEPFSVCLRSKTIGQYVSNGDGLVSLVFNGKTCGVERSGLGKMLLSARDAKNFPPIPYDPNINWNILDAKEFCRMLTILLNGVASDDSRPILTAILLSDGRMASADGFRLYSIKSEKLTFGLGDKEALLYRSTAQRAVRLFSKKDKLEVGFPRIGGIGLGYDRVYFRSGDTVLVGNLVQGTYPRYEKLIPGTFQSKTSFSVPLMMERLQIIDPMVIPNGILRVQFMETEKKEQVCLLTAGVDNPMEDEDEDVRYELSLPIKNESPLFGKIAIDLKYITLAIKYFSMCSMELTSPSSPVKFTGDLEWLTVVVMPMSINWGWGL